MYRDKEHITLRTLSNVLKRKEDVEKITRDVAEAGSSEVEKPVEVQSFTGEKKFVENEDSNSTKTKNIFPTKY
ncbi:hypothetical protein QE152_g32443 [Popillia japonica]|uniref:Uncharacterized protein n=1 Tax=Popillia japonica TaxID=7064 RepID=A0AAW1IZ18_POPJA